MTFRDGATDTAIFKPITGWAAGAVGPWVAVPVAPLSGDRPAALNPTLMAIVSAATPPAVVQFDLAAVSDFSVMTFTVTDTAIPNGPWNHIVSSTLTDLTTYWWRVRCGDGAGVWGPWSASQKITIDVSAGRGYAAVYINIGIDPTLHEDYASGSIFLNQGVTLGSQPLGIDYIWENVNFGDLRQTLAIDSFYLGEVSTDTPTPHIWWLRPNAGRSGDGIEIICFGAGDLETTFNGVIEMYKGLAEGWVPVPVNSWQVYPPTASAYTGSRTIDELTGVIDPQHQIIEITVPAGAVPPGYSLRIRTNGP